MKAVLAAVLLLVCLSSSLVMVSPKVITHPHLFNNHSTLASRDSSATCPILNVSVYGPITEEEFHRRGQCPWSYPKVILDEASARDDLAASTDPNKSSHARPTVVPTDPGSPGDTNLNSLQPADDSETFQTLSAQRAARRRLLRQSLARSRHTLNLDGSADRPAETDTGGPVENTEKDSQGCSPKDSIEEGVMRSESQANFRRMDASQVPLDMTNAPTYEQNVAMDMKNTLVVEKNGPARGMKTVPAEAVADISREIRDRCNISYKYGKPDTPTSPESTTHLKGARVPNKSSDVKSSETLNHTSVSEPVRSADDLAPLPCFDSEEPKDASCCDSQVKEQRLAIELNTSSPREELSEVKSSTERGLGPKQTLNTSSWMAAEDEEHTEINATHVGKLDTDETSVPCQDFLGKSQNDEEQQLQNISDCFERTSPDKDRSRGKDNCSTSALQLYKPCHLITTNATENRSCSVLNCPCYTESNFEADRSGIYLIMVDPSQLDKRGVLPEVHVISSHACRVVAVNSSLPLPSGRDEAVKVVVNRGLSVPPERQPRLMAVVRLEKGDQVHVEDVRKNGAVKSHQRVRFAAIHLDRA